MNNIINYLIKSVGMKPWAAQQIAQQLPQQLAKSGIDISKIPPDGLLHTIKETYGRIKTGKTTKLPPKPPMMKFGGNSNVAHQNALAQMTGNNNK